MRISSEKRLVHLLKRLAKHLPRHRVELVLSYNEYIDCWSQLIVEAYRSSCLSLVRRYAYLEGSIDSSQLPAEMFAALIALAEETWTAKPRISYKLKEQVKDDVIDACVSGLSGEESLSELIMSRIMVFGDLRKRASQEDASRSTEVDARREAMKYCAMLSRFSLDASGLDSDSIERLNAPLAEVYINAWQSFVVLTNSSIVDGNTLFSARPRFIVSR